MNTPWENPVKKRLREGLPVVAATITVASPEVAAHTATLGFDFLWIEMEHSPITLETLRNIVLATRGLPALTFARVPVNEIWTAKRVLDAGVSGVMFPFTSTPELAAQAAAACRYPPHGRRGSGAGAGALHVARPRGRLSRFRRRERDGDHHHRRGARRGAHRRDRGHARRGRAVHRHQRSFVFARAARQPGRSQAARRPSRALWKPASGTASFWGRPATTPEIAQHYMEQGFLLFQAPTDMGFMAAGARRYLEPLDKSSDKAAPRGLY